MGRLRKSVVDQIVRLRNQGFTQIEVAEKTGIDIKSVQKYDPKRKSREAAAAKLAEAAAIDRLEREIKCLGDWIDAIVNTLRFHANVELMCPSCMAGTLGFRDEADTYSCKSCGYEMSIRAHVWNKEPNKAKHSAASGSRRMRKPQIRRTL